MIFRANVGKYSSTMEQTGSDKATAAPRTALNCRWVAFEELEHTWRHFSLSQGIFCRLDEVDLLKGLHERRSCSQTMANIFPVAGPKQLTIQSVLVKDPVGKCRIIFHDSDWSSMSFVVVDA